MASDHVVGAEPTKPLEEKIAGLNLEEKAGLVAVPAEENLDGSKDTANITSDQVKIDSTDNVEKASHVSREGDEQRRKDSPSREVKIAEDEVQQSSDDGAYEVPTVDHRCIKEPGGEEKAVDVPTAVVHENADHVDKSQKEGKGVIQSVTGKITSSVKNVFSGFTGGKAEKNDSPK